MNDDQTTYPTKRKRGRPVIHPEPEQIPDSAENVLRAVLATPPRRRPGGLEISETSERT